LEVNTSSTVEIDATRLGGPGTEPSGAGDYALTGQDIQNLPAGRNSALSDVLTQMPGVSIDQNQQIHIRNTEGPQFQYVINGVVVPLDINTNPPFVSMINPLFIRRLDLLTGVLPARYSYATGGVIEIETRQGCEAPASNLSVFAGQRATFQPSFETGGCRDGFEYWISGLYNQSDTAFSAATPGPSADHDHTNSGQAFGVFAHDLDSGAQLGLILSAAASDNQLPNIPGLAPAYSLAGSSGLASQNIDSSLDFRDALAILSLRSAPRADLSFQVSYAFHTITQAFRPDIAGELIYQGVASTTTHRDSDNTLQADLTARLADHTLSTGLYVGAYSANITDSSRVFAVDASGAQTSGVPLTIDNAAHAVNTLSGLYLDDLWALGERLTANVGIRWDKITGFTAGSRLDPTLNLSFKSNADTTLHGGFARYFQVPIFQGISPTAPAAFAGTTAGGPPGTVNPMVEDDYVWDLGWVQRITPQVTISEDNYYEVTRHYLDTGQFGVVPIFAPFNYERGDTWGSEIAASYRTEALTAYTNLTVGRSLQKGVATGQFNFDPAELAYIDQHSIVIDHQPLVGATAGFNWRWRTYSCSADGTFSSGLRGGFADEAKLPKVVQLNLGVERSLELPGIGTIASRLTLLNVTDRINLIRPAEGIGIFQAAYGPRRTLYYTLGISF